MPKLFPVLALLLLPLGGLAQSQSSPPQTIKVRNISLTGTQLSPVEIQNITEFVQQQTYAPDTTAEISERVRYGLQRLGYFKSMAGPPAITVVQRRAGEETVDAALEVVQGALYRLKQITFTKDDKAGEFVFPESELRKAFAIQDGDVFDTEKIRLGLDGVRRMYADKGYVNCTPVPSTTTDDHAMTVSLRLDLDEGQVYHIGALALDGVEPVPGAAAKLLEAWKPYQGQVYNDHFMHDFIQQNAAYLPTHADVRVFPMFSDPPEYVINFLLDFGK